MTKDNNLTTKVFKIILRGRESMPFDEFIKFALYHPKFGYYTSDKIRVGKSVSADFYTSSTLGTLWGELLIDSCKKILNTNDLSNYTFVEIAAEPNCSVLHKIDNPFKKSKVIRLDQKIDIPERSIVFSNELFDAQPFKRYRFRKEIMKWEEIGVSIKGTQFEESSLSLSEHPKYFPEDSIDEYTIDWPTGAHSLMQNILSKSWKGMFLTFDYGLPRQVILNERPMGTARAYSKHKSSESLLTNIGEQDLTCHLCWEELSECLNKNNFSNITLQSQESFLIHHSHNKIKEIFDATRNPLDNEMLKLRELIHPQHMGEKFQALWGLRL